jgi:O-antigen/teichoic acid export membrane protein
VTIARRGVKLYFVATAVVMASALLRYTLLARLLGPEQLGLAATILLTGQFFDSISDSGGDRFVIQDRDGDEPRVQRLVHSMLVSRGVLIAVTLVLFSGPIAALYRAPALAPAIMVLAASPLIFGWLHTDMTRVQRHHDFRAEGAALLTAETISTVVTAVAAYLTRDFSAVLWGLIARSLMTVLMSHVSAQRPYRLGFAKEHARRLAAFAAPLMVNGLMLFLGGQGDRVLVGNQLGPAELGQYSTVSMLAYYPMVTLARFAGGMHLPRIAAARDEPMEQQRAVSEMGGQTLIEALVMMCGFVLVCPLAIHLLFGPEFAQVGLIIALVAVLQMSRFMRLWPTTVALAFGRSGAVMVPNIIRLLAFPAALAGMEIWGGVRGIVTGFILGEVIALVCGLMMVSPRYGLGARGLDRVGEFIGSAVMIVVSALLLQRPSPAAWLVVVLAWVLVFAVIILRERETLRSMWRELANLARRYLSRA